MRRHSTSPFRPHRSLGTKRRAPRFGSFSPDHQQTFASLVLAPLTTKNTDRVFPFEALIEAGDGVPRQSKVLLIQLRGMSKSRILSYLGTIAPETLDKVDAALKIAVGLEKV